MHAVLFGVFGTLCGEARKLNRCLAEDLNSPPLNRNLKTAPGRESMRKNPAGLTVWTGGGGDLRTTA